METAKKRSLLQCIKIVYDTAKENSLDDALFEKIDGDLKELSRHLEVSKKQAFFLANFFVICYNSEKESIMTLFKFDPLGYWKFRKHLEIIYSNI